MLNTCKPIECLYEVLNWKPNRKYYVKKLLNKKCERPKDKLGLIL